MQLNHPGNKIFHTTSIIQAIKSQIQTWLYLCYKNKKNCVYFFLESRLIIKSLFTEKFYQDCWWGKIDSRLMSLSVHYFVFVSFLCRFAIHPITTKAIILFVVLQPMQQCPGCYSFTQFMLRVMLRIENSPFLCCELSYHNKLFLSIQFNNLPSRHTFMFIGKLSTFIKEYLHEVSSGRIWAIGLNSHKDKVLG